jgi:dolichol-phosphate mannosyltransferase
VAKVLIAIPVYNEQRYIAKVLEAVCKYGLDILVVDDGSTDATPAILSEHKSIRVIRHPENRGYGQSLIDAFRYASCRGYDWVITMDCDEQHEPAQIASFLREIEFDDADVISGSRYHETSAADDDAPADRRRINHTINQLLDQILALRVTDSFCGFKAHRVAAMSRLCLDEPGYAFPLQFWVQCVRARLRIREIPVRRIYRDLNREFGGTLDDPAARLQHYLEVFLNELRRDVPAVRCSPAARICEAIE